MIGNDIVDLTLAKTQSNWQRRGFLEKQFTSIEIESILAAEDPFLMVWRFWSMKEAAYKAYTRSTKKPFFNPKKLSCAILNASTGKVSIKDYEFFAKTSYSSCFVHTIVKNKEACDIESQVFSIHINTNQSVEIRQIIKQRFHRQMTFKKDEYGIPSMINASKTTEIPISISHHGRFGAYAIQTK